MYDNSDIGPSESRRTSTQEHKSTYNARSNCPFWHPQSLGDLWKMTPGIIIEPDEFSQMNLLHIG